jgi:hypothetical protein
MGDHTHQMAILLLSGGIILYGAAFVLFCLRFFRWLRLLKEQKIDLHALNFLRRLEAIKPYQREGWLQAGLVFLPIPVVSLPLSFLQSYLDATTALSICLVWPCSLLLYAILSKDFDQREWLYPPERANRRSGTCHEE